MMGGQRAARRSRRIARSGSPRDGQTQPFNLSETPRVFSGLVQRWGCDTWRYSSPEAGFLRSACPIAPGVDHPFSGGQVRPPAGGVVPQAVELRVAVPVGYAAFAAGSSFGLSVAA